ncbi:unnamed protein product [Arctia plantaginis]|uniref:Uncharacterized protein n=1 Tax=Arctia plantaginis TaxID=874455 RepID=A0A8S0ZGW4_ARCPL|nr:unnamed protein product [Arctia plantaginis]
MVVFNKVTLLPVIMVLPRVSRGKTIVALINNHNNSSNEQVTSDEASNERAKQTTQEMRSLSNESSSSTSSSSDSDSSDDTFIEDSDDSVKDPIYIPPIQQNSADPKKDMCDVCAIFKNSDNKENLKDEYNKHLKEKELCRAEKAKDKEDENIVTAVYDLQAVFQCPKGDVSVFYYKWHTQNEGDAAHSLIERQIKKLLKAGPLYSPEAFIGAVKTARKKPAPFHVNEMCTEDFVDWKDACTQMGLNLTKDEEGNSPAVLSVADFSLHLPINGPLDSISVL